MSNAISPAGGGYHETRSEVRYGETDQMGYAHHANAVVWFELGRVSFMRAVGLPYSAVEARGLLNRVATRLYFDGDPANAEDPVLKMVDPARRPTLLAKKDAKGAWHLPIHLGGPAETVFFDF